MSDNKSIESRRKLLKSIAAGSGAIVAGKSLPENWKRPVVNSVMLPAHAQTSPSQRTITLSNCSLSNAQYITPTELSLDIAFTASSNYGQDLTQINTIDAVFTFQPSGTSQNGQFWATTNASGNGTGSFPGPGGFTTLPAPAGQTSVTMTMADVEYMYDPSTGETFEPTVVTCPASSASIL